MIQFAKKCDNVAQLKKCNKITQFKSPTYLLGNLVPVEIDGDAISRSRSSGSVTGTIVPVNKNRQMGGFLNAA